jgi:WD40 repeat protein
MGTLRSCRSMCSGVLLTLWLLSPQLRAFDLQAIEHIALSDDGSLATLADRDGGMHLYRLSEQRVFRSVNPYAASQLASVMSVRPQGELVATSGPAKLSVLLWTMTSGRSVELTKKVGATRLAFSPDGKQLAGALVDGRVVIWNVAEGDGVAEAKEVITLKDAYGVAGLEWSNNGKLLAVATDQQELLVWFPAKNRTLFKVKAATESFQVTDMAFSPDGRQLATAGGLAHAVWEVASGKVARKLEAGSGRLYGIAWNAQANQVVGLSEQTFIVWDPATGKQLKELPADLTPHDACFSRDGTIVLTRPLRSIKVTDLTVRNLGEELDWRKVPLASASSLAARNGAKPAPPKEGPASENAVLTPVVLPELKVSEKVLSKGEFGEELVRHAANPRTPAEKPLKSMDTAPVDLRALATAVGLSDDSKTIAAGGSEGEVFVGDAVTGKMRSRWRVERNDRIGCIQPSPDGKFVVVCPGNDNYADLFTSQGEPVARVPTEDSVGQVVFSPLGTYVALGADDRVILFDLTRKAVYASLDVDPVLQAVAVSPDEKLVAFGHNNYVGIWDVSRDRVAWHYRSDAVGVQAVAFSPDGAHLAASCHGAGVLHVFKIDGTLLASEPLVGAAALAFQSPDRLVLAAHGAQDTLLIKIPDAKLVEKYPHPSGGVNVESLNSFVLARNGQAGVFLTGNRAPLSELKQWRASQ